MAALGVTVMLRPVRNSSSLTVDGVDVLSASTPITTPPAEAGLRS